MHRTQLRLGSRLAMLGAALALGGCGDGDAGGAALNDGSVTVDLPPATPLGPAPAANKVEEAANVAAPAATLPVETAMKEAPPPTPPPTAPEPAERNPAGPPFEAPEQVPQEQLPRPLAADDAEPDAAAVPPPLPPATIASTLRRIGYACPDVVSTERTGAAGASSVYRITCSSGAVYRGTTRRGRLYFRRWR